MRSFICMGSFIRMVGQSSPFLLQVWQQTSISDNISIPEVSNNFECLPSWWSVRCSKALISLPPGCRFCRKPYRGVFSPGSNLLVRAGWSFFSHVSREGLTGSVVNMPFNQLIEWKVPADSRLLSVWERLSLIQFFPLWFHLYLGSWLSPRLGATLLFSFPFIFFGRTFLEGGQ